MDPMKSQSLPSTLLAFDLGITTGSGVSFLAGWSCSPRRDSRESAEASGSPRTAKS